MGLGVRKTHDRLDGYDILCFEVGFSRRRVSVVVYVNVVMRVGGWGRGGLFCG